MELGRRLEAILFHNILCDLICKYMYMYMYSTYNKQKRGEYRENRWLVILLNFIAYIREQKCELCSISTKMNCIIRQLIKNYMKTFKQFYQEFTNSLKGNGNKNFYHFFWKILQSNICGSLKSRIKNWVLVYKTSFDLIWQRINT